MNSANHNIGRFLFVVLVCVILYLIILGNLYLLQIKQYTFFKDLGEKQYNITIQTLPARALIYDRYNNPIAINKDSLSAFILPKTLLEKDKVLAFLKKYFPEAHKRFENYQNKSFMYVKRTLSDAELKLIERSNLAELHILKESSRYYPYESLGSVVGITDIDNRGQMGLEQQYNQQLQGSPTTYQLKKNAKNHHFYFEKETKQQGCNGIDLHTTLDATLQFKFQQILDASVANNLATEAGAIAMNPTTGEILAVVSYPHFNPNNCKEIDIQTTKCRPIVNCFESGSVLKIFGAVAAIQEGVTTLDEVVDCENKKETYLDHLRIRTPFANGAITFLEVIQNSNNIGTVKVMKRLGTDLYDYYKLLGFGELTGLKFPGEQKGFVNPPQNWSAYSIQSLAYGYEITTSLLQLARAMSLIINGGYLVTPQILQNQNIEKTGPLISQKTCEDIKQILQAVIKGGSGTKAKISEFTIYGKTGTANILENGKYNENRHLYTFIGAVEKNSYQRVIACYIKDSKKKTFASMITAPLFKELAEAMILQDLNQKVL